MTFLPSGGWPRPYHRDFTGRHGTLTPRIVKAARDSRVTLSAAKQFMVIDHDEDNNLINGMIDTAFAWLQPPTGCLAASINTQTLRIDLPAWPPIGIHLPAGPVQKINSVKYFDDANADQTLDAANYFLDYDVLLWSQTFAAPNIYQRPSAVRIEYDAGMSDEEFNAALGMAMLRIVKQLYDNRDELTAGMTFDAEVFGVDALIRPWLVR